MAAYESCLSAIEVVGDHVCYAAGYLLCGGDVEEFVGAVGVGVGA